MVEEEEDEMQLQDVCVALTRKCRWLSYGRRHKLTENSV